MRQQDTQQCGQLAGCEPARQQLEQVQPQLNPLIIFCSCSLCGNGAVQNEPSQPAAPLQIAAVAGK